MWDDIGTIERLNNLRKKINVNISKAEMNDFRIRRNKILKHLGSSSLLILLASSEKREIME